jgi:hypothetical protein
MKENACPICLEKNIEIFFEIENAPIFSLVTVKTKAEALDIETKRIDLGLCHNCGFIFNTTFDKNIDYFTAGYEDQQGFSKTFMKFLSEISTSFIKRHNLNGKNGLEIGCGKGDFIKLISNIAGGNGIGIDPAYETGRQTESNLTFKKEFYSLEHGQLDFDYICCRHTLEHIHDPVSFLKLILDSIEHKPEVKILFEIPQMKRILDVQAFWDIYYEHCSYFTPGVLASVFRRVGFEIIDLRLAYDNQYVVLEATTRVDKKGAAMRHNLEEPIEEVLKSVKIFNHKVNENLRKWRSYLAVLKKEGKKAVIWGGGSKAVGFLTQFNDLKIIDYIVDINPHMAGNFIPGFGIQYVSPSELTEIQPDVVIIMNGVYQEEIRKTLQAMDLRPELRSL